MAAATRPTNSDRDPSPLVSTCASSWAVEDTVVNFGATMLASASRPSTSSSSSNHNLAAVARPVAPSSAPPHQAQNDANWMGSRSAGGTVGGSAQSLAGSAAAAGEQLASRHSGSADFAEQPQRQGQTSGPGSARATPSYLRWAKDLSCVMEDYEGLQVFKVFLLNEDGNDDAINFYFGCKFLSDNGAASEPLSADDRSLIKGLYAKYVRRRLPCIGADTRQRVRQLVAHDSFDRLVYDQALAEVVEHLRVRHALFVRSDMYLQAVQEFEEHGAWLSNPATCGDAAGGGEPSNAFNRSASFPEALGQSSAAMQGTMSTVGYSAFELHDLHMHAAVSGAVNPAGLEPVAEEDQAGSSSEHTALSTVGARPPCNEQSSNGCKSTAPQPRGSTLTAKTVVTRQQVLAPTPPTGGRLKELPPNPYHTNYVPNVAPSIRDSAVSSAISSGADTASSMEQPKGGRHAHSRHGYGKYHPQQMQHMLATGAQHVPHTPNVSARDRHHHSKDVQKECQVRANKETNMVKIIPRTQREDGAARAMRQPRPDGSRQERDQFAKLLCDRLREVQRSQERDAKLAETLLTLQGDAGQCKQSFQQSMAELQKLSFGDEDDRAVLDAHFSQQQWGDSAKHSPGGVAICTPPISAALQPALHLQQQHKQMLLQHRRRSSGSRSPDTRGLVAGRAQRALGRMEASYPVQATSHAFGNTHQATSSHGRAAQPPPPIAKQTRCANDAGQQAAPQRGSAKPVLCVMHQQQSHQASVAESSTGTASTGKQHIIDDTSGISSGMSSSASAFSAFKPAAVAPSAVSSSLAAQQHKAANISMWPQPTPATHATRERSRQQAGSNSLPRRRRGGAAQLNTSGGSNDSALMSASQHVEASLPQQHRPSISVGYYLPGESVPYKQKFDGDCITLKQFKSLVARKGGYRYFFKCADTDFDTGGAVYREVSDDTEPLPLWEGKVMAKIEDRVDESDRPRRRAHAHPAAAAAASAAAHPTLD